MDLESSYLSSISCIFMCIQVTSGAINTMRLRLDEINCRKLMFIGLGSPVNPSFVLDRETRLKSSIGFSWTKY